MLRQFRTFVVFFWLGILCCINFANAQSAYPTVFPQPILLLDQERLFVESQLGKAILQIESERRQDLFAESRSIDRAFEREEQEITDLRSKLTVEEFSALSRDFDVRVQVARETQLSKDRNLQRFIEENRTNFLKTVAPFMLQIMRQYQASAIVDQRSVLFFTRGMDITDEAIIILDKAFAENPELVNLEVE